MNEVLALGETALRQDSRRGYGLIAVSALAPLGLFYNPRLGAYLIVLSLALLMGLAARDQLKRRLALSAAIIPLLGMVDLSIIQDSAFEQTAVLYIAMLVLAVIYRASWDNIEPKVPTIIHKKRIRHLVWPAAIIVGAGLGVLSAKLLATGYAFGGMKTWQLAIVAVIGAVAEENLFRGLIQRQAAQLMRPLSAAVLACLLYLPLALNHFTYWSLLAGALTTIALSGAYMLKPSLVLTTSLNLAAKLAYIWVSVAVIFR